MVGAVEKEKEGRCVQEEEEGESEEKRTTDDGQRHQSCPCPALLSASL